MKLPFTIIEADPLTTLKGPLPLAELRREILEETMPCGRSFTIQYFHQSELVRQDVAIVVEQGVAIGGETGKLT
jgi:hypothetical protein